MQESPSDRTTLAIARALLWTLPSGVPNTADSSSGQSKAIAAKLVTVLNEASEVIGADQAGQTRGSNFEDAIRDYLRATLPELAPDIDWDVRRNIAVDQYLQYRHLDQVAKLVEADPSGLLRDALGTEYLVRPDVTVSRPDPLGAPFLHASVSCKWTIRSDRVQNARHEANVLLRHRRGRAPHIVVVTAEPLPSRLASIGQGTGEIDRTYHLALPELRQAVEAVGNGQQQRALEDLIRNDRLADLSALPGELLY